TGTSSIQDTFYHSTDPGVEYINWTGSNHSQLFVLLFQDPEKYARYHMFKNEGAEYIAGLPEQRDLWLGRVSRQMSKAGRKTMLFSGEDISSPQFDAAAERMHGFFKERSDDVSAFGYARPPKGFIESSFQQNLRGGIVFDFADRKPRPNYRRRFEKIFRIFGPENVTIKEFSQARLWQGDVVKDFARHLGIAAPKETEIRTSNESLSLEATALLYVQRRFGKGFVSGFANALSANNRFVATLSGIGERRLAFSNEMVAPLLTVIEEDVAWMEDKLGHAFSDPKDLQDSAICSVEDLMEVALQCYDEVLETAGMSHSNAGPASLANLVAVIEAVREQSYAVQAPAR
ncbi:MAG: hypothetical protein AAFY25_11455, partial [Pseudomonadota bacterium]